MGGLDRHGRPQLWRCRAVVAMVDVSPDHGEGLPGLVEVEQTADDRGVWNPDVGRRGNPVVCQRVARHSREVHRHTWGRVFQSDAGHHPLDDSAELEPDAKQRSDGGDPRRPLGAETRMKAALLAIISVCLLSANAAAGTISGTVTQIGSATPLPSMRVSAYDAAGVLQSSANSDGQGHYTL